eukprot:g2424.t1
MSTKSKKVLPETERGLQSSASISEISPETAVQQGVSKREDAYKRRILQSHLNDVIRKFTSNLNVELSDFVKSTFNLDEIWENTYGTYWNPTVENLKKLSQNFLLCCMLYIKKEAYIHPKKVIGRFVSYFVVDVCELAQLAIIVLFFQWGEVNAGWILLGCTILERLLQTAVSFFLGRKSFISVVANLLGAEVFLISYFLSFSGFDAKLKGSKMDLFSTRLLHKSINAIFISVPLVVLNSYILFTKLSNKVEINTVIQIQIVFVVAISLSVGYCFTNLVQEYERKASEEFFYKSVTQIYPPHGDHLRLVIAKMVWNTFHFTMVTCGLGALIAKTPGTLWLSLLVGYLVVLNAMRYIINEGEMRIYRRMNTSAIGTGVLSTLIAIVYVFGVGLMPLSVLRWHNVLGPTVFGVGWITSSIISSVSLLCLSSNTILWVVFGCLSFFYVLAVATYFLSLEPGAWRTFVWSKESWKEKLKNEFWENPYFSDFWEDSNLIGDMDAHYAAMVNIMLETDLPWNLLITWLKEKKSSFKRSPPIWLSQKWLALIPQHIKNEVWSTVELEELCRAILAVESGTREIEKKKDKNGTTSVRHEDLVRGVEDSSNKNPKALRQQIIHDLEKRRSSLAPSFHITSILKRTRKKEDNVPLELKKLFKKAMTISVGDIVKASTLSWEDFTTSLGFGSEKYMSEEDIILIILKGFSQQVNELSEKKSISEGIPRILTAAFVELSDEVSDLVLAFLFFSDANNNRWAGYLMLIFIGLNRFVLGVVSHSLGESWWRSFEGIMGLKCITDTYRIARDGPRAVSGDRELVTVRLFTLGIAFCCESLPQMLLQVYILLSAVKSKNMEIDGGIFVAQLISPWYEYLWTRKPSNWKECLRDELWFLPYHTIGWGIEELIGDDDANHARHICNYRHCYLPWDKIERWLLEKKESFLESPPLWMTVDWFDRLTTKVKKRVWKEPGELEILKNKVYALTNPTSVAIQTNRKIASFLEESLEDSMSLSGATLANFAKKMKSLNVMGKEIYGVQWKGTRKEQETLVITVIKCMINLMRKRRKQELRESELSSLVLFSGLELLTEVFGLIYASALLLSNETLQEGWIFIGAFMVSKLSQFLFIANFETAGFITFLEILFGARILTDAHRINAHGFDAPVGGSKIAIGYLAVARRSVSGLLQSTPQMIVTLCMIYSDIEHNGNVGGLFWIQLIFVSVTCLSLGIGNGKINHDVNKDFAFEKYYLSMSRYLRSDQSSPKNLLISSCVWYTVHYLIVCMGTAALLSHVSLVVSISIIGAFVGCVNMVRLIVNKGEIRFFGRMSSIIKSVLVTIFGQVIACAISSAFIPASLLRYPNVLGPAAFGFSWTVSFGLSVGFVFSCLNDTYIHLLCGILCVIYVGAVAAFFASLPSNNWKTFLVSTQNWKDTIRYELWFDTHSGSVAWGDLALLGDYDAHFAGLIKKYISSDLPWDKLKEWLVTRKRFMKEEPPPWLSQEWLALIPSTIRRDIWTADEFKELIDVIRDVSEGIKLAGRRSEKKAPQSKKTIVDADEDSENHNLILEETENDGPDKVTKSSSAATEIVPKQTLNQERKESDLRQQIREKGKRRKSSVIGSFQEFFHQERGKEKRVDEIIRIPKALQTLLVKAETMTSREMTEEAIIWRKGDLVDCLLHQSSGEDVIPAIVCAMHMQIKSRKQKEKANDNNISVIIAAFCEITDEVSDVVMAILFSLNSQDLGWAATMMFVFIGINRFFLILVLLAFKLPYFHVLEAVLGIKCITDSYRIITKGQHVMSGGSVAVGTVRGYTLGIDLVCESLPQMMLQISIVLSELKKQNLNQDIFMAQLLSVLAKVINSDEKQLLAAFRTLRASARLPNDVNSIRALLEQTPSETPINRFLKTVLGLLTHEKPPKLPSTVGEREKTKKKIPAIGADDLNPPISNHPFPKLIDGDTGSSGGSLVGPNHQIFQQKKQKKEDTGSDGIVPGARFDPYGPGTLGQGSQEPNPDHLSLPGFGNRSNGPFPNGAPGRGPFGRSRDPFGGSRDPFGGGGPSRRGGGGFGGGSNMFL